MEKLGDTGALFQVLQQTHDAIWAEDADEALAEVYDLEALMRERYGLARKPRKPAAPRVPVPRQFKRFRGYRITGDGRRLCECGSMNYSEQVDDAPPALPARCWRCLRPL